MPAPQLAVVLLATPGDDARRSSFSLRTSASEEEEDVVGGGERPRWVSSAPTATSCARTAASAVTM